MLILMRDFISSIFYHNYFGLNAFQQANNQALKNNNLSPNILLLVHKLPDFQGIGLQILRKFAWVIILAVIAISPFIHGNFETSGKIDIAMNRVIERPQAKPINLKIAIAPHQEIKQF